MALQMHATKLAQRLQKLQNDPTHAPNARLYLGAVESMIEKLPALLARISNTFPHYTSHSIDHSITIVDRIGRCLPHKTLQALSPTEIYILIAGALLHDIGMVVPERDYTDIESLDSFKALREDPRFCVFFEAAEQALQKGDFWAAAFNRRCLIAEWVRRRHAERSAEFILKLPDELAAACCGDVYITDAIAKVCRAHGFTDRLRLESEDEYPRSCIIRDDEVDLAFCIILLRLGDLLDLGHERACPIVRSISEPLPGDSPAHWGRHRAVQPPTISPTRIKIAARCESQEEHAILHTWCQWLREEAIYCTALAAHSNRFSMTLAPPEIDIQPKVRGSYEFRQYRFELDQQEVFDKFFGERLYGNRCLFVRELLQNAIDATRCKLMDDVNCGIWDKELEISDSEERPKEPRAVPCEIRQRYPIRASLNKLDKEGWCLKVEDRGIGMDHESIQKYLLKVGRSYYRSTAFKARYRFRPISEFGIGLLSCFMVAENIEIETLREDGPDGAIHLTIPPWRQYLLTKPGTLKEAGTKVSLKLYSTDWLEKNPYSEFVELDKSIGRAIPKSAFGTLIQSMIRHIEFPVEWSDDENADTVRDPWESEPSGQEWVQISNTLWSRSIDIPEHGGIGRLYFVHPDILMSEFTQDEIVLSKEGIACSSVTPVLFFVEGHQLPRKDIDFRGSNSPALTIDRQSFVDGLETRYFVDLGIEYLTDEITLQMLDAPSDNAFTRALRQLARYSLFNQGSELSPLSDHVFAVWMFCGGNVRSCCLANSIQLVRKPISIKIESTPGRGAAECVDDSEIVLPLFDADTGEMVWAYLLHRVLALLGDRITSVNGYRVRVDRDGRKLEVDTEHWAAVRLGPRLWVLGDQIVQILNKHSPDVGFLPLVPLGEWFRWGPVLRKSRFGSAEVPGYLDMHYYRERKPVRADLHGAAYVMYTLRQYFPDLPEDLITDEQIPPQRPRIRFRI